MRKGFGGVSALGKAENLARHNEKDSEAVSTLRGWGFVEVKHLIEYFFYSLFTSKAKQTAVEYAESIDLNI